MAASRHPLPPIFLTFVRIITWILLPGLGLAYAYWASVSILGERPSFLLSGLLLFLGGTWVASPLLASSPWGRHLVTTATLCACGVLTLLKFLLLFVVIIVGSLLLAGQAVKQLRGVPAFLQDTFRGRGALRKNPNLRRDTSKRCEETFDTLEKLKTRDAEIDYLKRAVSVNNEKTDRDSFKAKAKRGGKYLRELL